MFVITATNRRPYRIFRSLGRTRRQNQASPDPRFWSPVRPLVRGRADQRRVTCAGSCRCRRRYGSLKARCTGRSQPKDAASCAFADETGLSASKPMAANN